MLPRAYAGFSLIELLVALAVISSCCLFSIPSIQKLIYSYNAAYSMQQVSTAFTYARSLAIAHNQTVTITYNGNWNQGILVLAPNKPKKLFNIRGGRNAMLFLQQNGCSNNQVIIQANGFAKTNGHFTYKSLISSEFPQYTLYFNKALRTYSL